jgi:tetratricopeptide (TPR) repeat protein
MRILVADETVAASKALRPFFGTSGGRKATARKAPKCEVAAGQLTIALPAPKRTGSRDELVCACSNLDLGDQPELAATILDALGMSLLNVGCIEEGAPLIKLARTTREKFFGKAHPAYAASQNSYSRLLREQGDYAAALEAATDAVEINRAAFGDSGLPVATSLNELGVSQLQRGLFAEAEKSALEGLDILKVLDTGAVDPNTTRLRDLKGRAETELGKAQAAQATYAELLPLTQKELGTRNHPKYAAQLSNAGLANEHAGKLDAAEAAYREAIRLYSDTVLNRSCYPNLADAYANLGSVLRDPRRKQDDDEEAGKAFEKSLAINQQVRNDTHPLLANDLANLGRWQYDAGEKTAAASSFRRAVRILQKNVDKARIAPDNIFIAEARTWLGRVLVETNSREGAKEAEAAVTDIVAAWSKYADGAIGAAIAQACQGRALYLQGKDLQLAASLLSDAYPVIESELGMDNSFAQSVSAWQQAATGGGSPPAAGTTAGPAVRPIVSRAPPRKRK